MSPGAKGVTVSGSVAGVALTSTCSSVCGTLRLCDSQSMALRGPSVWPGAALAASTIHRAAIDASRMISPPALA